MKEWTIINASCEKEFSQLVGIPITFQNMNVSKKQGYENYDKRTIPHLKASSSAKIKISRGQ